MEFKMREASDAPKVSEVENKEISEDVRQKFDELMEDDDLPEDLAFFDETHYYDDNGELYRIGNELMPNSEYEIHGYKYKTDELGRIILVKGLLHLKYHEGRKYIRDSIEDIGKGDQREGDDRGHLIGDQFDGSNGLENMIPQDADVNRNDFKNFENELASSVKEGKRVDVKIEPQYEGDSRRPTAIIVTYSIDGKEGVRFFPNGGRENG